MDHTTIYQFHVLIVMGNDDVPGMNSTVDQLVVV